MSSQFVKENSTSELSLHPGGIQLTVHNAALAGISSGDKVLDIGCGTGASLYVLRSLYDIEAYGIDSSARILSIAGNTHPGISSECCDAASLPYPDGYFDAVMMECVLTIIEDPEVALNEAVRVLKKGGRLIISTLAVKTSAYTDAGPAAVCSHGLADPAALSAYLQSQGFELLYSEDNKKELTDYMIETIMQYGSLEKRIEAETSATGASVFDCCCEYDPKNITYCSYIFRRL